MKNLLYTQTLYVQHFCGHHKVLVEWNFFNLKPFVGIHLWCHASRGRGVCPFVVFKWNLFWKPYSKKACKWSKMSDIQMVSQVTWLYHLITGHPYCPVFRRGWYSGVRYSDGYCNDQNQTVSAIRLDSRLNNGSSTQHFSIQTRWSNNLPKFEHLMPVDSIDHLDNYKLDNLY